MTSFNPPPRPAPEDPLHLGSGAATPISAAPATLDDVHEPSGRCLSDFALEKLATSPGSDAGLHVASCGACQLRAAEKRLLAEEFHHQVYLATLDRVLGEASRGARAGHGDAAAGRVAA